MSETGKCFICGRSTEEAEWTFAQTVSQDYHNVVKVKQNMKN